MAASIPASAIVTVVPNVLGAGGTGLDLSGLVLTDSPRAPLGQVLSFSSAAGVSAYFGPASGEFARASIYFNGFDNSNIKPAAMLFTQYPRTSVASYMRGGNVSTLSLTQLRALTGTLTLAIGGANYTSAAIDLSSATSFSNAAALITTALANAADASFTGSITGTTLTVTTVAGGTLAVGSVIRGGSVAAGTTITAFLSGTGGTGTYTVSSTQTVASTAMLAGGVTVTYDSIAGAFLVTDALTGPLSSVSVAASGTVADALGLTAATGAVTSAGSVAATPAAFMADVINRTQNFVSFTTTWEPVTADKVAFAGWVSGTGNRFLYVMADTDVNATLPANTASAGYAITLAGYSGVVMIYHPAGMSGYASFLMGAIASIDYTQANGRTNLAFKGQAGLLPAVTDRSVGDNLIANGYNFYGAYATANNRFTLFYPGSVTGPFLWIDSYINQVALNNGIQLDLMTLLASVKSIPYNVAGYALIEAALTDRINAAVAFGTIRAGVTLSALQAAQVNAAAGLAVSEVIQQRGWYLQVRDAAPAVRAARGSPPVTFWYTDGQSIQKINLASIQIQ